jgi:hypothetical protein
MADLNEAVRKFASDLADKINSFVQDVTTLEVRTYTTPADQVQTVVQTKAIKDVTAETTVALRAGTSITFNGDTTQLAPTEASGEVNRALWELHQQAVQQAMQHRERMLHALGEAAASTLKALRVANNG